MLQTRRDMLSMLVSSSAATNIYLVSEGPKHSHRVTIESRRGEMPQQFTSVLLVRSSQWYHYRLNVFGQASGVEMIVCGKHDSCVPVHVWSVEEARSYEPLETATPLSSLADPAVRSCKYGSLLLIAALLSGKQEARDILGAKDFPRSTRYRYQARARQYATLKPGQKLNIS